MKSKNIYSIPLNNRSIYLPISDPSEHYAYFKHAIDFLIDFNVPIIAPLDGEVWNVKDDSKKGGDEEKYADWKYQNLITLKHKNNEYSQYIHLAYKSALVKIGDKVKKGYVIAKGIGMVGCTTAPHLHMMVFVDSNNKAGWKSLEIQFNQKLNIIRSGREYEEELAKLKYKKLKNLKRNIIRSIS